MMLTNLAETLRIELAPKPGRINNVLRITLLTVLVIILSETFQIPEPAYSAYVVFFISREESASTLLTALLTIAAITLAVFAAIAVYSISAGEPALRLPLMAIIVFASMYISQASPLGIAGFVIGFLVTLSLTLIDIIPPFTPKPATDILTESVLWLWVIVMLPTVLVVLANIFTGRDPYDLLNHEIAERLELSGKVLSKSDYTPEEQNKITACIRSGMSGLLGYIKMAGIFNKTIASKKAINQRIVTETNRLILLVDQWKKHEMYSQPSNQASACGAILTALAKTIKANSTGFPSLQKLSPPSGDHALLLTKLIAITKNLSELLVVRTQSAPVAKTQHKEKRPRKQVLAADAFQNPEYVRFALKSTLAIFIAYLTYNLLDWPAIRTCMITCFFVSLGSVGETVHKMTLRMTGAIIGGAIGLVTIIFIMPFLTTITGLCLMTGIVAFFAGWVATSSEKLSYAGLQIALAFFVCVLVGYGPSIDLSLARDRIIGVLFGNIVVFVIFSRIWPVSATSQAKIALATALEKLSAISLTETAGTTQSKHDELFIAFDSALSRTRRLISVDLFEPEHIERGAVIIDNQLVNAVEELLAALLVLGKQPLMSGYFSPLSKWLADSAKQIRANSQNIMPIPDVSSCESLWCRILEKRVYELDACLKRTAIASSMILNQERREVM